VRPTAGCKPPVGSITIKLLNEEQGVSSAFGCSALGIVAAAHFIADDNLRLKLPNGRYARNGGEFSGIAPLWS
jgi:hypothetical protein